MFNLFSGRTDASKLVARMVGVKMGDRLAQIGCVDGTSLGLTAAGVGLSGRAVAVVADAASAARAQKGAARVGVLVEVETAPLPSVPLEDSAFDVAVVDNTAGLLASLTGELRVALVRELLRILRPGGRVMVISGAQRGGFGALVSRAQSGPALDPIPSLLADGFKSARTLAERDGLAFVEALKPR